MLPQPDNVPSTSNGKASKPNASTPEMDPNFSHQELLHLLVGMITNERTTDNVIQDKSEEESSLERKTPEKESKESENRSSELLEVVGVLELVTGLYDLPSTSDDIPRKDSPRNLNPTHPDPPSLVMDTSSDSMGSTHSLANYSRESFTSNTKAERPVGHPVPQGTQDEPSNDQASKVPSCATPVGSMKGIVIPPRFKVPSFITSTSGVTVALCNPEIWREFYPQNEMIIKSKVGRFLFPRLDYEVKGLKLNEFYKMFMHFVRVDEYKYTFQHDIWEQIPGEPIYPVDQRQHPSGALSGSDWLKQAVSFAHLKLTNNPKSVDKDTVFLKSRHKFCPVITVEEVGTELREEFKLDLAEFFTVTGYMNSVTRDLKMIHNKRANKWELVHGTSKNSSADNPSTSNTRAGEPLRHPAPQVRPSNDQLPPNVTSVAMNEPYDLMEIAHSLTGLSRAVSTREASSNGPVQPVPSINLPSSAVAIPVSSKKEEATPLCRSEARLNKLIEPIHDDSIRHRYMALKTVKEQMNNWVTKRGIDNRLFEEKVLKTEAYTLGRFMRSRKKSGDTEDCYKRLIKFIDLEKEVKEEILNLLELIQKSQPKDENQNSKQTAEEPLEMQPVEPSDPIPEQDVMNRTTLKTVVQIDNWIESNNFTVKIFAEKILGCTEDEFLQSMRALNQNTHSGAYVESMKFLALSEEVKKQHAVRVKTILAETEKREPKIEENSTSETQKVDHPSVPRQSSFTDHPREPSTFNTRAGPSNGPTPQLTLARSNLKRKSNLPPSLEARLTKLIAPIHDDSKVSNTVNFENITQLVDKWVKENKVNHKLFVKNVLKTAIDVFNRCKKHGNRLTETDDCYKKMARFIGLSYKNKQEIKDVLELIGEEEKRAFLNSINSARPIHHPIAPAPILPQQPPAHHHPDASSELKSLLVPIHALTPISDPPNTVRTHQDILIYLVIKNVEKEVFVKNVLRHEMKEGEDIFDYTPWSEMTPTRRNLCIYMHKFLELDEGVKGRIASLLKEIGKPKDMPPRSNQVQPVATEEHMVLPRFSWWGEEYIDQALATGKGNDRPSILTPVSSPVPRKRQCQPDHIEKREALRNNEGSSSTSQLDEPSTSSPSSGEEKSLELFETNLYDDSPDESFALLLQFRQPPGESPIPDYSKRNIALLTQEFVESLLQLENRRDLWTAGQIMNIGLLLDFEKESSNVEKQKPTTSSRGTYRQSIVFTEHQNQCLSQIYSTINKNPYEEQVINIGKQLKLSPESVMMWFEVTRKNLANSIKS